MQSSTLSEFMSGTLSTGVGKFMVMVMGILGLSITTRILPPSEVGTFVILLAIVIFLTEVSNLGLNLAVTKFLPGMETEDEQRLAINTILYFRILTIVVVSLIALLISEPLFNLFSAPVSPEVLIYIPILVALESSGKFLTSVLQGRFQFKVIGLVNAISSIINFSGILMFVFWLNLGLVGLIFAKILSRVIAFSYAYYASHISPQIEFDLAVLKKMLVFGFPLQLNYIMSFIFQRMDVLLVGILIGPSQVAFYEIARRIPDSLAEAYEAFVQVFFPFVSKYSETGEKDKLSTMMDISIRWIVFPLLLGALIAFLFGEVIITSIFSDTYLPSVPVFGIVMTGLAVVLLDSTQGYALIAIGQANKIPQINFIRTLLSFVAYFLLIPRFGIIGAAMSGPIAMVLVNPLVVFFLTKNEIKVNFVAYIKCFLLLGGTLFIFFTLQTDSFIVRVALVLIFIAANLMLSVVTIQEVKLYFLELKSMIEQRVRKRKRV